ncbi:MAG TPA: hypothetical protein VMR74_10290 [Gammaproteobacteria bacterium]|nr:hypothetical protein [Gammaproteobacteria bacterium]
MRLRKTAWLIALILAPATPALAQAEGTEGVRVFEPSYYEEFDPVSALQMVFRTPGFQPQENDGGRGLAGVRSNILINGKRPPPKGQSIRQQLRETPVGGVAWIELIDAGARLDIDMQGFGQVVNVVTLADAPAYYSVTTQVERTGTGDVRQQNSRNTQIEATGSFSWRGHEFTIASDIAGRSNQSPAGFVSIDPANPEQRISSLSRWEQDDSGIDFNALFNLPGESSFTFNGQISGEQSGSMPVPLAGADESLDSIDQTFDSDEDQQDFSAEYRRPFAANGELMFAVVDAVSTDQAESSLTSTDLTRSSLEDQESGESAARLLVTNAPTDSVTVRTTVTTAHNYFEGRFRLFEDGIELPVEGSDSRVEEDRRSLESSVDWTLNPQWLFSGSLGIESYQIESRDVSSGLQTDPKGGLTISYRPQPRTTLSFASQRTIGQLSFNQFLASSNLSSDILTAGAAELEPVRRWIHNASYDRRFGDIGVVRLELQREKRDNPIQQVALSDELIVAQNTSPQRIDSVQASVELPLSRFGREDLILGVSGAMSRSETIDPVTGEVRQVSGNPFRFWQVQFRRDPRAGNLAWSFSVGKQARGEQYSVRTINDPNASHQWDAQVEWEPIDGLKLRTSVQGPRTDTWSSRLFPAVRQVGLDPSFYASTTTYIDPSASFTVEWRRRDKIEVTASFSSRPEIRTEESLTPFGAAIGSLFATEVARAPQAMLRVRVFR